GAGSHSCERTRARTAGPWRAAACRRRDDLRGRQFDYPQLVLGTVDEVQTARSSHVGRHRHLWRSRAEYPSTAVPSTAWSNTGARSCTRKTRPRWAQRLFMLLRTHWIRLRRRSTFTAEISLPRLAANGILRRLKSAPMTWRIPCELLRWRTNDFAERC